MPAMASRIYSRVGMTALCSLLRILLCFEFVPPPNLLFFTFVFVFAKAAAIFRGLRVSELDIFFFFGRKIFVGHLVRHTGVFVGHFEKMSDCPTSPTNFDSTAYGYCLL